jgi:hypothetical protein
MFARVIRAHAGGSVMGAATVVAAIGFGSAVFMLGFLIALVREGAPAVCYWVVPSHRKRQRDSLQLSGLLDEGDYCEKGCIRGDGRAEFVENKNHENGNYSSGLITLDVRTISGGLGWRAIQSQRNYILRERRL